LQIRGRSAKRGYLSEFQMPCQRPVSPFWNPNKQIRHLTGLRAVIHALIVRQVLLYLNSLVPLAMPCIFLHGSRTPHVAGHSMHFLSPQHLASRWLPCISLGFWYDLCCFACQTAHAPEEEEMCVVAEFAPHFPAITMMTSN
jgi:hypothetical protein